MALSAPSESREQTGARPYRRIAVTPLAAACGAEISGVSLGDLDDETFAEIRRALLEHLVLFFRDQDLNVAQHKAFGRRFGSLNVHPQYVPLAGEPEIIPVVKEPGDKDNIGDIWHTDITFLEKPSMGAVLYGIEVPEVGGDTLFANQQLAYDSLSGGMKAMLSGLRAWHSDRMLSDAQAGRNATRSTRIAEAAVGKPSIEHLHPVVRSHPETGRKSLFVNRAFTTRFEDMTEAESRPLLNYLTDHGSRPEFTCRFRWRQGSVAFWDNRCLMHYALNDYPGQRRYMHRVTIDGDRPA